AGSAPLEAWPSEQEVPSATGTGAQPPVIASQVSAVQGSPSSQLGAGPATQAPAWQVSSPLQAFPSEQEVPSATGTCVHPITGSQASAVQGLPSSQLGAGPATQAPARQVSSPLQAFPSEQEVPSAMGVCVHPATGSQTSAVQGLRSSQSSGVPATQAPFTQASTPLHTF